MVDEIVIARLEEIGFENPLKTYKEVKWRKLDGLTLDRAVELDLYEKIRETLDSFEAGDYI